MEEKIKKMLGKLEEEYTEQGFDEVEHWGGDYKDREEAAFRRGEIYILKKLLGEIK